MEGSAGSNSDRRLPITRDEQMAQLDVNDKYAAYLDAEFELTRAGAPTAPAYRRTGKLGHSDPINRHSLHATKAP